jgi:hypothetical protein
MLLMGGNEMQCVITCGWNNYSGSVSFLLSAGYKKHIIKLFLDLIKQIFNTGII